MEGTPVRLVEGLTEDRTGAEDRAADRPKLGRAGVEDDRGGADRVTQAEGADQPGERLLDDLGVVRGAVEEVDGVDQYRADLAGGEVFAEAGVVLLGVGGRPPGPGGLV